MSTNVPNITRADAESLAAKLAEFGGSLPAPEQALLWRALSGAPSDEVQGYTLIETPVLALIAILLIDWRIPGQSAHPFAVPSHPSTRV